MQIQVDKFVTFSIGKCSTKSGQFHPKFITDGRFIPTVKTGESFRYLGRHFVCNMSNNTHSSELFQLTNSIRTDIDLLPLLPKSKILVRTGIYSSNCLLNSLLLIFLNLGCVSIWIMLLVNTFVYGWNFQSLLL